MIISVIGRLAGKSVLTVAVLVLAACGSRPAGSSAPGSVASIPAAGIGTSPTHPAATSPTADTSADASSGPAAKPTATPLPDGTFKVSAREFSFSPKALEVKAGEPFAIVFQNFDDPGVIHDVDIRKKNGKTVVVDQKTTDGGQTADYQYPKLEAGEYVFICSVHPIPGMTGTLTVK